jgi:nucleotide-binding universal stress UspA family protein
MKIILCIDYSSFTEKMLNTVKYFVASIKEPEITVLHIIDQQLFYGTTGYEVQLNEDLQRESKELKELCILNLGPNVNYMEEYGIPNLKINEVMQTDHDLLIIGSHGRHGLRERLVGSTAEHVLRNSKKPVLVVP